MSVEARFVKNPSSFRKFTQFKGGGGQVSIKLRLPSDGIEQKSIHADFTVGIGAITVHAFLIKSLRLDRSNTDVYVET